MWHLYWHYGRSYFGNNALDARRRFPEWSAELDSDPVSAQSLRVALEGVRDRGWAHHIQRLMVVGNHALQREYRPGELTEWFATAFVDGLPWVMPVNVIGMSQRAGDAYINRMSDHCRECPFDPRERGDKACPFTAGYWAWMHRHADALGENPRMKQLLAAMRRLTDLDEVARQEHHRRHVKPLIESMARCRSRWHMSWCARCRMGRVGW